MMTRNLQAVQTLPPQQQQQPYLQAEVLQQQQQQQQQVLGRNDQQQEQLLHQIQQQQHYHAEQQQEPLPEDLGDMIEKLDRMLPWGSPSQSTAVPTTPYVPQAPLPPQVPLPPQAPQAPLGQTSDSIRVNVGIDEDLRMILEMDPSIMDLVPPPVAPPLPLLAGSAVSEPPHQTTPRLTRLPPKG